MMDYVSAGTAELIDRYEVDTASGLRDDQVLAHRARYGSNTFSDLPGPTLLQKTVSHLLEVMNLILLATSGLAFYLAFIGDGNYLKSIVVLAIVIINVVVSMIQEERAESALAALKELSSPTSTVLRDGRLVVIDSSELVVGDIIQLTAGEQIGADVRLISASSLQVDESSLTGESEPIDKDADAAVSDEVALGDRLNMVFSGTNILNGTATGIVVAVGAASQMGQIADLIGEQVKGKTPLQKRINTLAKRLAVIAFCAGGLIFVINAWYGNTPLIDNLMTAVVLGIAAVPETLPVIVTLSLIYGVGNMARKQAITRNIPAVETLGNATVIASDKTGTLTQNLMVITRLWVLGDTVYKGGDLSEAEEELVRDFALASNAVAHEVDGTWEVHGDPTETAIIRFLVDRGLYHPETWPERVLELPFDSDRKKMTVVVKREHDYLVLTKGAFDRIVEIATNLEGDTTPSQVHDRFAGEALRMLALSYKVIDHLPEDHAQLERDQRFLGLIGMIDPPRPESEGAVAVARAAGIKPIMITGDHALTARAIARQLDIYRDGDMVVDGVTLAAMSEAELSGDLERISVYARVSPEDKLRIVQAWQNKGQVVAMTGDGVNDAPSLRAADVGTAMGIAGTEVAKSASDIILSDDNFATIVKAVREGRRVYLNIKRAIYYLLSANVAEIIIMLLGALVGWGMPLTGMQLLYINVLADGIPGFGLSREKADDGIMDKPPIDVDESLFSRGVGQRIATSSVTFIIISLIAFYLGRFVELGGATPSLELGRSMAFLTLTLASTYHIFNARSNLSILKDGLFKNQTVFWTTMLSLAITLLFTLTPLRIVVDFVPLSPTHWAIAISLSLAIFVVIEGEKAILRRRGTPFLA